jgi:hypothetical protein
MRKGVREIIIPQLLKAEVIRKSASSRPNYPYLRKTLSFDFILSDVPLQAPQASFALGDARV